MQTTFKKSYRFALRTALSITLFTTLIMGVFLYYFFHLQWFYLLVYFIGTFLFSFGIIQISVERFIYKRIKKIYDDLTLLESASLSKGPVTTNMQTLTEDIDKFARDKKIEIETNLEDISNLTEEEQQLIDTMQSFGGRVSWRSLECGERKPYEINIALYDALKGTIKGEDEWNKERFICAHTIMFGLEGVPAIYIHSLLATGNDYHKMEHRGHNRAINRHQWDYPSLELALNDENNHHADVFSSLKSLLAIRQKQTAFHPNATQFTLHIGDGIIAFWRQSQDQTHHIYCISNIHAEAQEIMVSSINLNHDAQWHDLISGATISLDDGATLSLSPYQSLWISNLD